MRDSASIRVKSTGSEVFFEWLDFDGDDSFSDFHIVIVNGRETERFDFDECAIWGLRNSVRFFRGELDDGDFGFRFPDIRTYRLSRIEDGFSLQIHLEARKRSGHFLMLKPTVTFDEEFLKEYDADKS